MSVATFRPLSALHSVARTVLSLAWPRQLAILLYFVLTLRPVLLALVAVFLLLLLLLRPLRLLLRLLLQLVPVLFRGVHIHI